MEIIWSKREVRTKQPYNLEHGITSSYHFWSANTLSTPWYILLKLGQIMFQELRPDKLYCDFSGHLDTWWFWIEAPCFESHIDVVLIWLHTHSRCLFFIQILTCGYKCGYNYLFLFIKNINISLLGVKFESGLRTIYSFSCKINGLEKSFCLFCTGKLLSSLRLKLPLWLVVANRDVNLQRRIVLGSNTYKREQSHRSASNLKLMT